MPATSRVELANLDAKSCGTGKKLACAPVRLPPGLELVVGVRLNPVAEYKLHTALSPIRGVSCQNIALEGGKVILN